MYKVMLVDDEEIVIEGLKKKIDWQSLQLEVAGVAQDGLEALKIIEETTPDILITDVIMPVMDGLKLIETIKAMGKNIKTIILSGHDEFSYAQKALKLGASEYQLKPISVEELEELLERIITKINEERQEEQVKSKLKRDNMQNSEIVKRHIFTSIIEGRADKPDKLTRIIHDINREYLISKIVVSVIEIDDYPKLFTGINSKERELAIFSMLNITGEIVESNNKGFVVILDDKRLAAITFYDSGWSIHRISNSYTWLFNLIKENIKKYQGYSVTIAVGQVVDDVFLIRESYLGACEALKYKLLYGKGRMIHSDRFPKSSGQLQKMFSDDERHISELISALDKDGLFEYIDQLHKNIVEKPIHSYEDVINVCYKLVLMAKSLLDQYSNSNESTETEIALLEQINKFEGIDQLMRWIKEFFSNVFDVVKSKNKRQYNSIVNYVIENIEKNYMSQIELNGMAQKLFLSANYLSTLFKKETGISFKSYLTNYRLDKAKKMLQDPQYKIYQIANLVGYENEEYLCRLFKSNFGITCKEYRDRNNISQ